MKFKKVIAGLLVTATVATSAFSVSGLTAQMVTTESGLWNSIKAEFLIGEYGTGLYGTDKTKVIKQCSVRLIEGSYDSGKVKSKNSDSWGIAETSKLNDPFNTCYTYYNWYY